MATAEVANIATYLSVEANFMYSSAPALSEQLVDMPHCQDAPPIFGPLPKSGGGRNTMSSPNFLRPSAAPHEPLYKMAVLPLRKSLPGSVPDFNGISLSVASPRNQVAHSTACGPLSTPSADL